MQIGFVNFNTEEKKRVAKIMQLLQESEAIEELGIGKVRDHFSNTLFPGTSTLQHHAKYLVLMPSLYYHIAFKSKLFQTMGEVDRYIKEAEVQITRQLSENPNGTLRTDTIGITGIDTYKDALSDYRKYVKYDPAYIYGSALVKYGIIPKTSIERLILELNKKYYADPHNKMIKSDDATDDAGELSGDKQFIKTCGEVYNFFDGETMNLALTEKESNFLKDRINDTCEGTMLSFLINSKNDIPKQLFYYDVVDILDGMTSEVIDIYSKSVLFSKLVHLIDWRFNYCYFDSFGKINEAKICEEEYNSLFVKHKDVISNQVAFHSLFNYIRPIDMMLTDFCESCYQFIFERNTEKVDQQVKAREYTVKHERSKIGNSAYKDKGRGKPFSNTFRWDTVRTMVNEIRNPQ